MSIESFSAFFMSPTGAAVSVVILIILITFFALNLKKNQTLSVKALVYCSICIALATVLSNVKIYKMPMGGTVTACSMLFISIIGYWFGAFAGILAAVTYGVMQLIFDPYIIHPVQLLLDYPIAFGVLGISGFFANAKHGLVKGYIAGALVRWLCSTISGIVFFYEYAGSQNVLVYSSLYNITYIAPEIVITVLLISVPAFKNALEYIKRSLNNTEAISS